MACLLGEIFALGRGLLQPEDFRLASVAEAVDGRDCDGLGAWRVDALRACGCDGDGAPNSAEFRLDGNFCGEFVG